MAIIDSKNTKILVCCHKKSIVPDNELLLSVHGGAANSSEDFCLQRDDKIDGKPCENISTKNESYCELTVLYWAWKNIKKIYPDLKYIGLYHYRRYFSFDEKNLSGDVIHKQINDIGEYSIDTEKLEKYLHSGKIIVPKRMVFKYPLYIDYCLGHLSQDLKVLRKVVHDIYPDYDNSYYTVMFRNNKSVNYNMFIMDWNSFCEYCTWLFSILAECEKRIDISHYNPVQKRIFGYMAERLFNVWLIHNDKKLKYLDVKFYDDGKSGDSIIRYQLRCLKKNIANFFVRYTSRKINDWSWLN